MIEHKKRFLSFGMILAFSMVLFAVTFMVGKTGQVEAQVPPEASIVIEDILLLSAPIPNEPTQAESGDLCWDGARLIVGPQLTGCNWWTFVGNISTTMELWWPQDVYQENVSLWSGPELEITYLDGTTCSGNSMRTVSGTVRVVAYGDGNIGQGGGNSDECFANPEPPTQFTLVVTDVLGSPVASVYANGFLQWSQVVTQPATYSVPISSYETWAKIETRVGTALPKSHGWMYFPNPGDEPPDLELLVDGVVLLTEPISDDPVVTQSGDNCGEDAPPMTQSTMDLLAGCIWWEIFDGAILELLPDTPSEPIAYWGSGVTLHVTYSDGTTCTGSSMAEVYGPVHIIVEGTGTIGRGGGTGADCNYMPGEITQTVSIETIGIVTPTQVLASVDGEIVLNETITQNASYELEVDSHYSWALVSILLDDGSCTYGEGSLCDLPTEWGYMYIPEPSPWLMFVPVVQN